MVCGGRDFYQYTAMAEILEKFDRLRGISVIIEGDAPGADRLAGRWARESLKPLIIMPAPWEKMGRQAGMLRNRWMLEHGQPDVVIAFPGGIGTAGMVRLAKRAGVEVVQPLRNPKAALGKTGVETKFLWPY
jgi:hypothetical protein